MEGTQQPPAQPLSPGAGRCSNPKPRRSRLSRATFFRSRCPASSVPSTTSTRALPSASRSSTSRPRAGARRLRELEIRAIQLQRRTRTGRAGRRQRLPAGHRHRRSHRNRRRPGQQCPSPLRQSRRPAEGRPESRHRYLALSSRAANPPAAAHRRAQRFRQTEIVLSSSHRTASRPGVCSDRESPLPGADSLAA